MRLLLILPLCGLAIASAARDRYAALQIVPDGLTPRYFVDKSHPLFKREGSCGDNAHSCKTTQLSSLTLSSFTTIDFVAASGSSHNFALLILLHRP